MPAPEPRWLVKAKAYPVKTKNVKDRIRYLTNVYRATPAWLTPEQVTAIKRTYRLAKKKKLSVDHIVPLRSSIVCGLHVPWNLQLMPKKENVAKSNTYWPDCPYSQETLV
jgi:hypothetical protein